MAEVNANALLAQLTRGYMQAYGTAAVRALIPVRTGRLRRSLKVRVFQRANSVVLQVQLLDYHRHIRARNSRTPLTLAISRILNSVSAAAANNANQLLLELAAAEIADAIEAAIDAAFGRLGNDTAGFHLTFTRGN